MAVKGTVAVLPRGGGAGDGGSKIRVSLCLACHLALLSSRPTAAVWSLYLYYPCFA